MKRISLIIIMMLISYGTFGQGEANYWFFGENAGLNFNENPPVPISGSLSTNEGCSTFSDKDGNLLFYSDGTNIWNRNHQIMPNGSNLLGNPSSTQSAIIVPHPGNDDRYYLFTVGANYQGESGFNCYVVDMTEDNGLGDIIQGPINLSDLRDQQWTEKVTSVKAADCKSFWVLSLVQNDFYAYKVDENGLNQTPVISSVSYFSRDVRGYLKVSPDGTKLASATYNLGDDPARYNDGRLHLYSFNDATGEVANNGIELINDPGFYGEPYGLEFSPASSKLYASTFDGSKNYLYQYDLTASNIKNSQRTIHSEFGYRGGLQLAPDGKIYVTIPVEYTVGTRYLDVINYPDAEGSKCDFRTNAVDLGSGRAMQGLPPFIASLLLPIEITDSFSDVNVNKTTVKRCIGDYYKLQTPELSGDPTYKWTFKDSIISTSKELVLDGLDKTFEGTYYLEVQTIDECDFKLEYQGEVTLEVYDPPTLEKPQDLKECDNDADGLVDLDLAAMQTGGILNGQDENVFEVLYFTDEDEAHEGDNAISMPYTNSAPFSTDRIYVRIQNIDNPVCYEISYFDLTIYESPFPPDSITLFAQCDSDSVGTDTDGYTIFDLTQKNEEILNGQNAGNFQISFFEDVQLLNKIQNPTSFTNSQKNGQTIYFMIENKENIGCFNLGFFEIEVFSLPEINDTLTLKQCDEDGTPDGFTNFNLDEANDYFSNGVEELSVTYYLTKNDAESKENAVIPAPFSNATATKLYARIENQNECFRIGELNLLVSSTSFPTDYLKIMEACDDDDTIDGLRTFILSENTQEIISLFPQGQNLSVTYYRNLSDAQLEVNSIDPDTPYLSEVPFSQLIYVRVESEDNGACFGLGPYLNLLVYERPEFDLPESAIYCQNLDPITVSTFNPKGNYSYEWRNASGTVISTNPDAIISAAGLYTVVAYSGKSCASFEQTIEIMPSVIADLSEDDVTIIDDSLNNTITIGTDQLGIGDYEFSLNEKNGPYQDHPVFENILPGIHTVYIRDKNGCGIALLEVSVLGYPKFFTPNNDGLNDRWNVLGANRDFYKSVQLSIFNRFGKLLAQIELDGQGWNGMFNGEILPASDYWFTAELIDNNDRKRLKKGHFSLIRR